MSVCLFNLIFFRDRVSLCNSLFFFFNFKQRYLYWVWTSSLDLNEDTVFVVDRIQDLTLSKFKNKRLLRARQATRGEKPSGVLLIVNPVSYNTDLSGKIGQPTSAIVAWTLEGNQLLSDWIWSLLHRREFFLSVWCLAWHVCHMHEVPLEVRRGS